MANDFEHVFFADYIGVNASTVPCGAMTDGDVISQVRNTKPVAASKDAALVRTPARMPGSDGLPHISSSVSKKGEKVFCHIRYFKEKVLAVAL